MKKKVTAKEKTETWKKEEKIKQKEEKTKKKLFDAITLCWRKKKMKVSRSGLDIVRWKNGRVGLKSDRVVRNKKKTRSGYGSQKENISTTFFAMRQENSFRCHHHQMKEKNGNQQKKGDKVYAISACFAQNH